MNRCRKVRISTFASLRIAKGQEVALGPGEPLDGSGKKFRVKANLPEGAIPGDWHISVIWLFLSGSGWTPNTISYDNVTFKVEGQAYALPTKAAVKVARINQIAVLPVIRVAGFLV